MSYSDDQTKREMEAISEMLLGIFEKLPGPLSDIIRSSTNATVDSLIDARARMIVAGWEPALADAVVLTIINRNAQVVEHVAERFKNRQSGS
jgi:hypothetical protein